MALSRTQLPKLSVSRSIARFWVRSLSLQHKPSSNSMEYDQKIEFLGRTSEGFGSGGGGSGEEGGNGNKVMVVVDTSIEAKGAFEWALSHTVQKLDTIVLLLVAKPSKQGPDSNLKVNLRAHDFLHSMKNVCQRKRPGVQVLVAIREGKEKGPIIVEEAQKQKVPLLVLGQRKRSIMWSMVKKWAGKRNGSGGAVNNFIQNAPCMTTAVRRKGKNLGGYLITTKRHKNFWLFVLNIQ